MLSRLYNHNLDSFLLWFLGIGTLQLCCSVKRMWRTVTVHWVKSPFLLEAHAKLDSLYLAQNCRYMNIPTFSVSNNPWLLVHWHGKSFRDVGDTVQNIVLVSGIRLFSCCWLFRVIEILNEVFGQKCCLFSQGEDEDGYVRFIVACLSASGFIGSNDLSFRQVCAVCLENRSWGD